MKIGFVSLGCSKNLVDTEMMIGIFKNHHFTIVNNPKEAEVILINTCGFIESAKEEAINTILEMAEYKKKKCQYLIVTGCLVERYLEELKQALPEVDLFINCRNYEEFWNKIENVIPVKEQVVGFEELAYNTREVTTGDKMAYLKIAEGCSNCCTYCAIPSIRGPFISRRIEDILEEARGLANKGIEEIIVIAQDTTKYGIDIYGEPTLTKLLQELSKIANIKWIRFLYAYPETITEELIQEVKTNSKICHYFDIPIQHISNHMLKRMNRRSTKEKIEKLLEHIRTEIPDVILRTSLIVGFPGETKEDFEELYEFVEKIQFNKLGVFPYSKEEGTPASTFPEQIHPATKQARYRKIMELQQKISKEKLEGCIQKEYVALIEGESFDHQYYIGRTYMDVPDMDGVVFISKTKEGLVGTFVTCQITEVQEYDLIGKLI